MRPEIRVPDQIKPIQMQPEHPMIINMGLNQPTQSLINQNQLFQTANGQICQLIHGPNNTFQMVAATQPAQPQLIQPEVIVNTENFFEEIPVVLQAANGQQTILNLPHHQVQALQQQIVGNQNQQQQLHQPEIQEAEEIEIQEYEDQDQFACEDMEEVTEEEFVQVIEQVQEESSENSDTEDKQLLAEFLAQQTNSEPGRYSCNLCNQEFKHQRWLTSHLKTIHQNWIKANMKKQPQCQKCGKSFRGPGKFQFYTYFFIFNTPNTLILGMLKMHMKTHEKENKLPSCSVCFREFKSKSILYRHRATHFQNQKQHRCELCNKTFSSNYQLSTHLQRHQKNELKVMKNLLSTR